MNTPVTPRSSFGPAADRRDPQARHAIVIAEHFFDHMIPHDAELALALALEQLCLQDLFRAQRVTTMHQRDMRRDVSEVESFFDGGIASADDGDALVLEEEPIARRAGGDAAAAEVLFRRKSQVFRRGAGGDDQRVARVCAAIALETKRSLRQIHGIDVIVDDLSIEALRMFAHALHQSRAGQIVRIARPVVDFDGRHELAAFLHAGDQHGAAVGARGVDGRCIACRAGTQDQEPRVTGTAHV